MKNFNSKECSEIKIDGNNARFKIRSGGVIRAPAVSRAALRAGALSPPRFARIDVYLSTPYTLAIHSVSDPHDLACTVQPCGRSRAQERRFRYRHIHLAPHTRAIAVQQRAGDCGRVCASSAALSMVVCLARAAGSWLVQPPTDAPTRWEYGMRPPMLCAWPTLEADTNINETHVAQPRTPIRMSVLK